MIKFNGAISVVILLSLSLYCIQISKHVDLVTSVCFFSYFTVDYERAVIIHEDVIQNGEWTTFIFLTWYRHFLMQKMVN